MTEMALNKCTVKSIRSIPSSEGRIVQFPRIHPSDHPELFPEPAPLTMTTSVGSMGGAVFCVYVADLGD